MIRRLWRKFIYKPGTEILYWEKIISSAIVIIAFIVWAYFNQTKVNRLKNRRDDYAKYTIGITTGSFNNIKGGRPVHYKYFVNNIEYSNSNDRSVLFDDVRVNGGRYIVKFDSTNPSNVEMLFRCPVPEYIKEAPENGWKERPIECKEEKQR